MLARVCVCVWLRVGGGGLAGGGRSRGEREVPWFLIYFIGRTISNILYNSSDALLCFSELYFSELFEKKCLLTKQMIPFYIQTKNITSLNTLLLQRPLKLM